jgi:hypothetical protein
MRHKAKRHESHAFVNLDIPVNAPLFRALDRMADARKLNVGEGISGTDSMG